jgi:hypothetical protein
MRNREQPLQRLINRIRMRRIRHQRTTRLAIALAVFAVAAAGVFRLDAARPSTVAALPADASSVARCMVEDVSQLGEEAIARERAAMGEDPYSRIHAAWMQST